MGRAIVDARGGAAKKMTCKDNTQSMIDDIEHAVELAFLKLHEQGFQPNFLFMGNSVLHVAALNAFLLKLKSEGVEPCGVVCNNVAAPRIPQFGEDDVFAVDRERRIFLRNEVDYRQTRHSLWEKTKTHLFPDIPEPARTNRVGALCNQAFYLITTDEDYPPLELWRAVSTQGKPVRCFLVEEGVGSYLPRESAHELFALKEVGGAKRFSRLIKARILALTRRRYRAALDAHCSIKRFSTYEKSTSGDLHANDEFRYWMKTALRQYCAIKRVPKADFAGKVVIVGTNFQELGGEVLELSFLDRIAQVVRACDLVPYLRPHPRVKHSDHYRSIGIEVDELGRIPFEAELAICVNAPIAIVGLGSSSQMLANAFWGVPCVNVAPILLNEADTRGFATRLIKTFGVRACNFATALPGCMDLVGSDDELRTSLETAVLSKYDPDSSLPF